MAALINPPTSQRNEIRYSFECDFALEPSFQVLVREAERAGWDRLQIALSMINLCECIIYGPQNIKGQS